MFNMRSAIRACRSIGSRTMMRGAFCGAVGGAGVTMAIQSEPSRCESGMVNGVAAALAGVGVGYFAAQALTDSTEQDRYQKYWPRKIMIIFGPPGAGKGTQSPKIEAELGIPPLSTGDMLRALDPESAIGREVGALMKQGKFATDEMVIQIISDRIQQDDCTTGFILDGFPRNTAQANALDDLLRTTGEVVSCVIQLDVPDSVLTERICGRWMHKSSGRSYHVKFAPPKSLNGAVPNAENMLDDETGEALYQRADDTEGALKKRLEQYWAKTTPILDHYAPTGVVRKVNANQAIEAVWGEVQEGLVR